MKKMLKHVLLFSIGSLIALSMTGCNPSKSPAPVESPSSAAKSTEDNKDKDSAKFSEKEVLEHLTKNLPGDAKLLNPGNLSGKKFIAADLDGDGVDEVIAGYRSSQENTQDGIIIIKEGTWKKIWAEDMRKENTAPSDMDKLIALKQNKDGSYGLLVGWTQNGNRFCDLFLWKDQSLQSIGYDESGNTLLGDYSTIVPDDSIAGFAIKHQNSAIYHGFTIKDSNLVSSNNTNFLQKSWLGNEKNDASKSDSTSQKDEGSKLTNMNALENILKVNLIETAAGLLRDKMNENINPADISLVEALKVNLSSDDPSKKDYIIKLYKNTSDSPWDFRDILLIFTPDGDGYKLLAGETEKNLNFQLADINTDGRNEIVMEKINQHKWDIRNVTVYSYIQNKLNPIFDEGLVWSNGECAYSFFNDFDFKLNEEDPHLLDITLKVNTFFDKEHYENDKGGMNSIFNPDIPKPVQEEYSFQFDGKKYVPDKSVYDYRKIPD
ncbi:MAG: hypothetical protein N2645_23005 [Clostridia bacterium]|nr:hypothetical protein [Clostridia bacterium]